MLIDTHCHLNLIEHFPNPAEAVECALAAGVEKMIVVGIDDETSQLAVNLAEEFDPVYACVGWHPTSTANFTDTRRIERLCAHPKAVAIGEIGLDYHWDFSTPEQQRTSLEAHWEMACRLQLPVVFHCREAYDDLLHWLEGQGQRPPASVMHCFAGDAGHATRAAALGCYFGVDGPITYKNADGLRRIVSTLPVDRILLETDAPFLTPHPHRGKPNSPAMIPLVCEGVADVVGLSFEDAAAFTGANARRAFPRLG